MAVSVVTDDCSMVKPEDSLEAECAAEFVVDFLLAEVFIAVYRTEALSST